MLSFSHLRLGSTMVFAIVRKPGWEDQIQPCWLMRSFLYPLNPFASSLLLSIRHLLTCRSVYLFVSFSFSCMTGFGFGWVFISSLILLSISLLSGVSRAVKYVNEFLGTALCTQVMDVLSVQPCHLDEFLQCMVLQTNIAAGIPRRCLLHATSIQLRWPL